MNKYSKENLKIIVIEDDRLWKSILRDTYSIGSLTAVIFVGWLIGSSALQWIAGLLAILFILSRCLGNLEHRMTISEARQRLDDLEEDQQTKTQGQ